jgi:tRNA A37 methylthiotransferase MiaB
MRHFLHDELTDDLEGADIVIINTCGVKGQTEHRVLRDIAGVMGTKKVIVAAALPLIITEGRTFRRRCRYRPRPDTSNT